MARLFCTVPNLAIIAEVTSIKLIEKTSNVILAGPRLSAVIADDLKEDTYDRISKQLRIIYSFCFEQVYPESYDISESSSSIGVGGHDERKKHLILFSGKPRQGFIDTSTTLFEDILKLKIGQKDKRLLFNLMFIWTRAKELEELQLLVEAYAQYWRILDLIKSNGNTAAEKKILKNLDLNEDSNSNLAAAKIEMVMHPNTKKYSKDNIETIAYLDSLRHRHAHKPSLSEDYYLEDIATHLDAEMNNIFISDITKLYVLWNVGLNDYYLKPRANIYELVKQNS